MLAAITWSKYVAVVTASLWVEQRTKALPSTAALGATRLLQITHASPGVEVSWNEFDTTGSGQHGISIGAAGASGLNINNNDFTVDVGAGAIWGESVITDLQITDNEFTGPGLGINSYAIELKGVAETTGSVIADNMIDGFNYGIGIFNGPAATPTDGLDILRNDVKNSKIGIWLRNYIDDGILQNVTVQANTLTGNTTGIEILDAYVDAGSISITNNIFLNNTTGINSQHNSASATIYENSFVGGTTGVSNTGSWLLNAQANWWDHATGPHNATSNPGGGGVEVTDNVDYNPWLGLGGDGEPGTPGFQMESPMDWGMFGIDGDSPQNWIDNWAGSGDTLNLEYNGNTTLNGIDDSDPSLNPLGVSLNITTVGGYLDVDQKVDVRGSLIFGAGGGELIVDGGIDPLTLHLFSDDDLTINSIVEADKWILAEAGLDGDGSIVWSSGSLETFDNGGTITMTAGTEIGGTSGDIAVGGGVTTDAGDITLDAYHGAVTMTDAGVLNANGGKIDMYAGGGSITLGGLLTTSNATDAITINTNAAVVDGGDTYVDVDALNGGLVIDAATGVGTTVDAIETTVASINIENTTSGNIVIEETDGIDIVMANAGGGDVTITATAGSIRDDVDDTAAPSVDVVGATINLTAASGGIGTPSAGPVDGVLEVTAATALNADTTADGSNINIDSIGDLPVGLVNAAAGNVTLNSDSAIRDDVDDTAAPSVDVFGATINLTAASGGIGTPAGPVDGVLEVTAATALNADTTADGSNINIDSIGDLPVGLVNAAAGNVTLNSDSAIRDDVDDTAAPSVDVVGATINLTAASAALAPRQVRLTDVLEVTAATALNADTTADGSNINIDSIGDLPVGLVKCSGW